MADDAQHFRTLEFGVFDGIVNSSSAIVGV